MINGPKSQRTFSIIIKLISFGRNHYQKSEKFLIFSLPGHRPESVHFESVCFILAPIREKTRRDFYLATRYKHSFYQSLTLSADIQTFTSNSQTQFFAQVLSRAESLQKPFQLQLSIQHSSHQRPETETIKRDTRAPQAGLGRSDICLLSAKFLTTHSRPRKHIWEIGKVTKIKMCPDVNFPLGAVTGPGHQSNVQLRSS